MTYKLLKSSDKLLLSLLFLFLVTLIKPVSAQEHLYRTHSLSPSQKTQFNPEPVTGTLTIVAVMVEFQPDTNPLTSGNGTFEPGSIPYLENPGTTIDALPHNKAYFEAHLEFVRNYFTSQSNSRLDIRYEVLPKVYRLDNEMAHYSPTGENPDLSILVNLVNDVWGKVAEEGDLNLQMHQPHNTAFIIFHAGIGRDIELTGTSLDRTPQDIPSVYLSTNALQTFLNDPSFTGFEIDNGNILVTNSLILPRTLSRSGEDVSGERFVLPLSSNGLITAQIASHLGLPDLFNTETGQSGIGQFGLMDGAGIFAWNGLFPPGLSAWEKIYLGWAESFNVQTDQDGIFTLPASSFNEQNSIAKASISNSEYFLIENRHRDPFGEGVSLTIRRPDGSEVVQTFTNRDEEFINRPLGFDQLLEPGVITNVSNYDFALPGGFDEGDAESPERELNGGILIWHIDDAVINNRDIGTGINSNPNRRGVNLVEADGAQDIGRPTQIGLGQNEANGSAFDFWWSGNNATVITQTGRITLYQNRLGPDTTPNNNSNSGAASNFELYEFSDNLPHATFRIRPVNAFNELYSMFDEQSGLEISAFNDLNDHYLMQFPLAIQAVDITGSKSALIPGNDGALLYNLKTKNLRSIPLNISSIQQPFIDSNEAKIAISENPFQQSGQIKTVVYSYENQELNQIWNFSTPPNTAFISSSTRGLLEIDGTQFSADLLHFDLIESAEASQKSETVRGVQSRITDGQLEITSNGEAITHSIPSTSSNIQRNYTGIIDISGREILVYLLLDGALYLFSSQTNFRDREQITNREFINWPAMVDLTQDGNPDFIFTDTDGTLIAKNRFGASLHNFPLNPPGEFQFTGTPLIADITGDGNAEIIITAKDSFSLNIYAYNLDDKVIDGFPLFVGGILNENFSPVNPLLFDDKLIALSPDGDLKVWQFQAIGNLLWRSAYGNTTNNKVSSIFLSEPVSVEFDLLNKKETYNWPNPAVDETRIRYQTSLPAEITINITTMSGRLIYSNKLQSSGGVAEEVSVETSNWASGGYFAVVEAKSGSQTERKIIKIAVVR
ncbi:MAG: T9SS C-terminal target domain-containing protein [Balneolaceae bacterium]|nr:MAG: T9SS C-terminal target domain-containing protein [Balneolaceae bacterium]